MSSPTRSAAALAFSLALLTTSTWGVAPVAPAPVRLSQPDGTTFTGYPKGSGYVDWMETEDGLTVLQVEGWWVYAEADGEGGTRPSIHRVGTLGEAERSPWAKHLHAPPDLSKAPPLERRPLEPGSLGRSPSVGSQPLLLLLVSFTDTAFAYSESSFVNLVYGGSASVKHYYTENSYGTFTVTQATETAGTANDGAGSTLALTWDTTCAGASNYAILYGMGSQLPAALGAIYGLAGAQCGLPAQGSTAWTSVPDPASDSRRFLWWVVVATAAGTEGSWGADSAGGERTGPGTQGSSGSCATAKNTTNSCS